jgi:hypothetical protein
MEQQSNDIDGKSKNSKKNLSQCYFAYHRSHMDSLDMNLGLCSEKSVVNHLRCGMA